MMRRLYVLGVIIALMVPVMGSTGCKVQKDDFSKKKYKIRKGYPPVQRYYNKWSPLNPHRK